MRIEVQYFALMREQAGRSRETVQTASSTASELYDELRRQHGFKLEPRQLRVAINGEFGEWQHRLRDGDAVVFIPPVAGG
jgi:molybdopterin converting factor subunit 1